jgi:hypothetical protein
MSPAIIPISGWIIPNLPEQPQMEDGKYVERYPESRPIREAVSTALKCKGTVVVEYGLLSQTSPKRVFQRASLPSLQLSRHWAQFSMTLMTPRQVLEGTWFESPSCHSAADVTDKPDTIDLSEENGVYVDRSGGLLGQMAIMSRGLNCPASSVDVICGMHITDKVVTFTFIASIPFEFVEGTVLDIRELCARQPRPDTPT